MFFHITLRKINEDVRRKTPRQKRRTALDRRAGPPLRSAAVRRMASGLFGDLQHRTRVLELLVAHGADGGLEELRRARQREQQPWLEDEAAVVHLPEGGEQLGLRFRVRRGTEPVARVRDGQLEFGEVEGCGHARARDAQPGRQRPEDAPRA